MSSKQRRPGSDQGELALLRLIRERANLTRTKSLRLGIGDDCALLNLRPGEELAITTDLSIAGRHFRLDWHQPESIGHRALARGLSDLAAMGARPISAFLSLGLPGALITSTNGRTPWVQRFLDGLLALGVANNTPLAGGDLCESPLAIADIVLTGAVPRGKALLRSGARAGHLVYVTGSLGGAAAGLARLAELAKPSRPARGDRPARRVRLLPQPRPGRRTNSSPHTKDPRGSTGSSPLSPTPCRSGTVTAETQRSHRGHRHQRRPLHRSHPHLQGIKCSRRG